MEEDDIPPNYEQLWKDLKKERENDHQVIHDYKKKIQVLEMLQKEYQEEIERLRNDNVNITKKFEIRIEQLEKEKNQLKINDEIQPLLHNLERLEAENHQLKKDIETSKKIQESQVLENVPKEDVEDLKENIIQLQTTIEDLNVQLALSQKKCSELEENKENLKNENLNLQESLELKREELKKNNEIIHDLQDNVLCLKAELDSLRNKPLDEQARGNSLFAEVNDSRMELLKKMKNMASKYNEMCKNRKSLLTEIDTLRSEKAKLIELFKSDMQEYQPGNQTEIAYYKTAIDGYQKLNESYKQELAKLVNNESSPTQKDSRYFEKRLKIKEKEIESLRGDFRLHLSNYTNYAWRISCSEKEMVKWKWKAMELENQIRMMEQKLEKLEDKTALSSANFHQITWSSSTEGINQDVSVKIISDESENESKMNVKKTVHFADHSGN